MSKWEIKTTSLVHKKELQKRKALSTSTLVTHFSEEEEEGFVLHT